MAEQISFGDNVRVRATPETTTLGYADATGQVQGVTIPSVTNVEVVGGSAEDCAFAVAVQGRGGALWFSPDLLELIDHAPGTEITINGAAKKWTRAADGSWMETNTVARPWWKFW
jgi:hypothetical protein